MNNNNEHIDAFLNMLKEDHNNTVEKINKTLFDDICQTAEMIEKTKDKSEEKTIIENLRERFKNEDLNQVTDLFIYNQMFFTTNENPLPTPSIVCIYIGKLFTEENLHYTATKVYSNDEIEGSCALSFLGYLAIQDHHSAYVLNFIKDNFEGFSQNKKTECVFQLKNYLPDNTIAKQIVDDSGITEYKLTFSSDEDSTSKPITFKLDNVNDLTSTLIEKQASNIENKTKTIATKSETPWWQFWKK